MASMDRHDKSRDYAALTVRSPTEVRFMRRLLTLALLALVPTFVHTTANAAALRFPKAGKHGFALDLPKGWHTKTDEKSGMLLIPPAPTQHVMVYLGLIVDDALRGEPLNAVADKAGREAGVKSFDKQEEARITASNGGALHRGTAFYGNIAEKRGHSRRAKIVIIPLGPNTWAQVWTVTQPGMNSVEYRALDDVLESLTLE